MQATINNIKLNDVLVNMYGYNMTLYNFYKVVKINKKSVQLQPLTKKIVKNTGFLQYQVKPIDKKIDKTFLKRACYNGAINGYYTLYDDTREYIENHAD